MSSEYMTLPEEPRSGGSTAGEEPRGGGRGAEKERPEGGSDAVVCPNCGEPNAPGAKYCGLCGEQLPITRCYCPDCGRSYGAEIAYCVECGTMTLPGDPPRKRSGASAPAGAMSACPTGVGSSRSFSAPSSACSASTASTPAR